MKKIVIAAFGTLLTFALALFYIAPTNAADQTPEFKAALAQMRVTNDTFKGITWYQDKSSPKYNNSNGFYSYIGTGKKYNPSLRLRIQYYGDDWLFIDKYLFNVDGNTWEINPSYGDVKTDNDSKVWEWFDTNPNKSEVELINAIIKSKKAVMRLEGSKYYKDVTITSTQKSALKRVLAVYAGFGGK